MHEFRQIGMILHEVEKTALENPGSRVDSLQVRISPLNEMTPGHLRQHFLKAAHGTVADGAKLEIHISEDFAFPRGQDIYLESVTLKE